MIYTGNIIADMYYQDWERREKLMQKELEEEEMSKMGQLNQMITEHSSTDSEYIKLLNEISLHIKGTLRYSMLSEAAKDILKLWEEDNESIIYNS
jgi:hypothetical protein